MPKKRYIIIAAAAVISLTAAFFMSGKPVPKNDIISESTVYSNIESRDESSGVLSSVSEQISEKEYSFESSVSVSESSSSSKAEESSAQEISEDEPSVQEKSEVSEISADEQSVQESTEVSEISAVSEVSEDEPSVQSENESSAPLIEESRSHCTVMITCHTLVDNKENLRKNKRQLVSDDGIILSGTETEITDGESVFDVTKRICTERKIPFEFTLTPLYNTAYVEGIYNLYEFDCGSGSGWIYLVNGEIKSCGCSDCKLNDGDIIEWAYTCDLGHDIEASIKENG